MKKNKKLKHEKLDKKIFDYFQMLEKDYPIWLNEYINTKEMLKQQYISVTCGTIYSNLFESLFFYSSLDHSIAVALIVWHFTHDKKQTLAGLFHDIATPAFKHCIDFLEGDYDNQEATEDLTKDILLNSKEIMALLKRDNIKLEEVCDYHIYPICDNDTPMLSADRLEYSLSKALLTYNLLDFNSIKKIYDNIIVKEINNTLELVFKDIDIALEFVRVTSKLSIIYREDRTRYSMQFIADIIKRLNNDGVIRKNDLYTLGDKDIIDIIYNSKYKDIFKIWESSKNIKTSKVEVPNVYNVHCNSKVRYINPIVGDKRIYDISKEAKKYIDNNLSYKIDNYVYIDNINME